MPSGGNRRCALLVGDEVVTLELAGAEQAIHTPALALVTMLHRNVVIAHGGARRLVDPDEARLLAAILAGAGNEPAVEVIDGAGHDLAEAGDDRIGGVADALVSRMESRELPPVLVAIEQMGREG